MALQPGDTINQWTIISEAERASSPGRRWLCRCSCGTERVLYQASVASGKTKSCGCSRGATYKTLERHGLSETPEYYIWVAMKQRCTNPNAQAWSQYGGRGITMCQRWQDSFIDFLQDVGKRPQPHLTLDRINNDGNYEPGNTRWVTMSVQATNRRNTIMTS